MTGPADFLRVIDPRARSGEPIFYADFVHDYPKVGGVGEYSVRLFKVLRERYGDRLRSMRAIEADLGPLDGPRGYLERERLALQRLALKHPGALVIVPNFQSPVSPNAPFRLHIVNVVHDVPHGNFPLDLWNAHHSLVDRMYRETHAHADHIAFVSEATRRHFCDRYGAPRSSSVVAPVMDGATKPDATKRENFLLAVAHFEFHEHKNFEGLVDLFAKLAARDPEMKLVLTGRGGDLFEASIADVPASLRARIEHRGYVPKKVLDELYRKARAFVSLSRFEGFDMPSVEAALRGAPLILSDIPVRAELFGDSACIVDALHPCLDTIEKFLAAPRAPRADVGHAFPPAVVGLFGKAIRTLEADANPSFLSGWAAIVWPKTKAERYSRHVLLASTMAASVLLVSQFWPTFAEAKGRSGAAQARDCRDGEGWCEPQPEPGGYYDSGVPILEVISTTQATRDLARDRQGLMVTQSIFGKILRGMNEQVNCTDCVSGFGSVGSVSFGFHGRKQITPNLSVVGGIAFAEYRNGGVHVTSSPIMAGLFRYDFVELGASRPFFEVGGILSPGQRVTSTRNYGTGLVGQALGRGTTSVTGGSVFGRLGWVARLTPQDEVAASVEISQGWNRFGGYSESGLPSNPWPMWTPGGTDRMSVVSLGGQWTHLWGARIETQFNAGVARSFGSKSGLNAWFVGGPLGQIGLSEYTWAEYGARIGYRIEKNFVIDLFADGTLGGRPVGNTIHGGIAARYAF